MLKARLPTPVVMTFKHFPTLIFSNKRLHCRNIGSAKVFIAPDEPALHFSVNSMRK